MLQVVGGSKYLLWPSFGATSAVHTARQAALAAAAATSSGVSDEAKLRAPEVEQRGRQPAP